MPDINKQIELLLNSDKIDAAELSDVANILRESGRFDLLNDFSARLLQKHGGNDDVLLLRAWYLADVEQNFDDAENILKVIGRNDSEMFVLMKAKVLIKKYFDADAADSILENYIEESGYEDDDFVLEASRLFITDQYTDLAEKWMLRFKGEKDIEYLGVSAEIMIAREDYQSAVQAYKKITEIMPDAASWTRLSDIYIYMKDYVSATVAARHAVDTDPEYKKALENICMCNLCLNRRNTKTNKINNQ